MRAGKSVEAACEGASRPWLSCCLSVCGVYVGWYEISDRLSLEEGIVPDGGGSSYKGSRGEEQGMVVRGVHMARYMLATGCVVCAAVMEEGRQGVLRCGAERKAEAASFPFRTVTLRSRCGHICSHAHRPKVQHQRYLALPPRPRMHASASPQNEARRGDPKKKKGGPQQRLAWTLFSSNASLTGSRHVDCEGPCADMMTKRDREMKESLSHETKVAGVRVCGCALNFFSSFRITWRNYSSSAEGRPAPRPTMPHSSEALADSRRTHTS